jgi:hypothetical protein
MSHSDDSKSASYYALKFARVVFPMNEIESLKDCFGVSEGCQDYHYMENLMARTDKIESSPVPSLRNLG